MPTTTTTTTATSPTVLRHSLIIIHPFQLLHPLLSCLRRVANIFHHCPVEQSCRAPLPFPLHHCSLGPPPPTRGLQCARLTCHHSACLRSRSLPLPCLSHPILNTSCPTRLRCFQLCRLSPPLLLQPLILHCRSYLRPLLLIPSLLLLSVLLSPRRLCRPVMVCVPSTRLRPASWSLTSRAT